MYIAAIYKGVVKWKGEAAECGVFLCLSFLPADRTGGTRLIRSVWTLWYLARTNICGVSYTLGWVQYILNLLVLLRECWLVETTTTLSVLWFLGPPAESTLHRCRCSCDTHRPWIQNGTVRWSIRLFEGKQIQLAKCELFVITRRYLYAETQ